MGLVYSFQPSGVKASKAYAQVPNDSIADFVFTRSTTATRVNKDSLIEQTAANVLRLDYSDGGCPVALFEPESTNLVTNYLGITGWTISSGGTRTANYGISPDGTKNSTRLQFDGTTNTYLTQSFSATAGQNYTFSFYAKRNDTNTLTGSNSVAFPAGTSSDEFAYTLGMVHISSFTSEWKRYTLSGTMPTGTDLTRFHLRCDTNGVDIEIFGIQLENLNYSTSVIPTTSGVVTRSADSMLTGTGLGNVINSVEGVIEFELAPLADSLNERLFYLARKDANNWIRFRFVNASKQVAFEVYNAGSYVSNILYSFSTESEYLASNVYKMKFKDGNYGLKINGTEVGTQQTSPTGSMPLGLNMISLASSVLGTGKIKYLKIYDSITDY